MFHNRCLVPVHLEEKEEEAEAQEQEQEKINSQLNFEIIYTLMTLKNNVYYLCFQSKYIYGFNIIQKALQ